MGRTVLRGQQSLLCGSVANSTDKAISQSCFQCSFLQNHSYLQVIRWWTLDLGPVLPLLLKCVPFSMPGFMGGASKHSHKRSKDSPIWGRGSPGCTPPSKNPECHECFLPACIMHSSRKTIHCQFMSPPPIHSHARDTYMGHTGCHNEYEVHANGQGLVLK